MSAARSLFGGGWQCLWISPVSRALGFLFNSVLSIPTGCYFDDFPSIQPECLARSDYAEVLGAQIDLSGLAAKALPGRYPLCFSSKQAWTSGIHLWPFGYVAPFREGDAQESVGGQRPSELRFGFL